MLMADAKAETGNVKFSDTRTRAAAPGVSSRKMLADPPGPDNAAVDIVPLLTLLTACGHRIASDGGGMAPEAVANRLTGSKQHANRE
jgi:hypothetical protein